MGLTLHSVLRPSLGLLKLLHQQAILVFQLDELLSFLRHLLFCFLYRSLLFYLLQLLLALPRLEGAYELLLCFSIALQAGQGLLHAVYLVQQLLQLAVLGLDVFFSPACSPVRRLCCIFGNLSSLLNPGNKASSNYKFIRSAIKMDSESAGKDLHGAWS